MNDTKNIEGDTVRKDDKYVLKKLPSGGISFLFNLLYNMDPKDTWVFVGDRTPTEKRRLDPDYKMTRPSKGKSISMQKDIVEDILLNCGIQVYGIEGYEADDVIYTLVQKYKESYDFIHIYTGDRDMAVCIDDNVDIMPCTSKNRHITKRNYKYTVEKENLVPFNTLSVNKMIEGDRKDNIKALPKDIGKKLIELFPPAIYHKLGSVKHFGNMLRTVLPEAYLTFQLVYPLELDYVPPIEEPAYDFMRIAKWGDMVENSKFTYSSYRDVPYPADIIELRDEFFDRHL